jgi:hypothetical protein
VRRMDGRGLIFRVTRIAPLSGLVFEIFGRGARDGTSPRRDVSSPDEASHSKEDDL